MKRFLSLLTALSFCAALFGCAKSGNPGGSVVSGSGAVEFTSSSSVQGLPPPAESPAAEESRSTSASSPAPDSAPAPSATKPAPAEARSVWISYLELSGLLKGKGEADFRRSMTGILENCADFGLNTVILQVRPFADAIYPSRIFPQSYLFTGTEGEVGEAPFDALGIAVEEAHKRGLRLEAWINPYRVRNKADNELSGSNPANALLESGDAVRMGEVITYNPASEKAQKLIVDGVLEIVRGYDVDGIHFDDYFYPTTDPAFDAGDYGAYQGGDSLAAWRRANVTKLVRRVHDAIKAEKPSVLFGISPQGNMSNNLNVQYVDVEGIVKAGLVDYICPQMYFGYQNSGCPYQSTIEDFDRMARDTGVRVYVGLATYKFNKADTWAGAGKNEWIGTTDILKRQVESARELSRYGGFVLYRYDSSFSLSSFYSADTAAASQAATEMENLKKIL